MLLCVAAVATLSSCSRDNEDLIIGKWEIVKVTGTIIENGRVIEDQYDVVGDIWEFKTDGTMVFVDHHNENKIETWTYVVSGNTILLAGGLRSLTITTLNKTKMVLEEDDTFWNGGDDYLDGISRYELKKI